MWSNFSSLARSEPLLFGNLQEGIWIGIVDQFVSPLKMDIYAVLLWDESVCQE